MTDSSLKTVTEFISEFLGFLWLLLAAFVTLIILFGEKIETIKMPSFRSLNFGQKPKEEMPEAEDLNGGFLNRKIVVEKVKNVFGKTLLKPKEKPEDEDFDIKKVIKIFQNGKKSVTFADKDEVINELCPEFETSTSFCEDEEDNGGEKTAEEPEVKNLLFHEVDANFKPENNNYTNVGFWKNGNDPNGILTIVIGQEPPKPPSEPPPLPPKLSQKKSRPTSPPPLPPKPVLDLKPPAVRRDLKKAVEFQNSSVTELVNDFIKLQNSVLEKETPEKEIQNGDFNEYEPIHFLNNSNKEEAFQEKIIQPTFSTFKPEPVKKDWKDDFFQPVNKSLITNIDAKPRILVKSAVNSKSIKIPKLVEEIMEKSVERKPETFASETLKKCKVNVSTLVNNFEQIQKGSGKVSKTTCLEPWKPLNGVADMSNGDETEPKSGDSKISVSSGAQGQQTSSDEARVSRTNSEVFFRAGVLVQLESQRDEKLADLIIQLQSRCRGYLARKKLAKLKVQDLAVRCIQRNVRKLMQVREWPWWKLYVKVTPLLNVHRTEEELTAKIKELETLKVTLEKLEQERNQLKLENDKLETKPAGAGLRGAKSSDPGEAQDASPHEVSLNPVPPTVLGGNVSQGMRFRIPIALELSEMTLDLSEERATGTMQAERLEAETAERVRLEQELSQVQNEKKDLQQTSERLEMELFYARADVNKLSDSEGDLEDGGGDAALYKKKCERAKRELEFTRRRLQQQHEDDLEQLVSLKKQLEKKLADAYEEVEEQRQVAAQWKRKVQKLQSETNDIRLLLEEQSSRNNLLEKKQRKFDSEIQMLQEELRSEKNQKERLSREKEMAVAEKYSLEQNLSSVRLELELKDEKVSALSREVDELTRGGGTEQEVAQLRKVKHDLDMKLKEQEEELDELAGQVSMLEANKLRLEMALETLRKEHRREMCQRDDELDEVRANAQKKIKGLESQLESEHEMRTILVREKHELERRLGDLEEQGRHSRTADENALLRTRRDLKKTKALLRDAQVMLEKAKQDSPTKAALRALKNQLEDAELARTSAIKAKQSLETELNDVSGQLEEALRQKGDAENRLQATVREMNGLRAQVEENEEEMAELLKKYRQTVQQLSAEQLSNQETVEALAEAEAERASLKEQLAEVTARLEAHPVVDTMSGITQKKLEIRIKEFESKLELEQTTRSRLEVQIARLKENLERLNEECTQSKTKLQQANDLTRKLQRSLRETKEELLKQQAKEQEALQKKKELEKSLEVAEKEKSAVKADLRLAVQRIEDLQMAISGDLGSDSERTESDEEDSENDSLVSHVASTISSTSRTSRTPELTPR